MTVLGGQRGFRRDGLPVFSQLRRLAVNFQPGQRVPEDVAMRQCALRARARAEVSQSPLQSPDLAEPFDIAAGKR